MMKNINRTAGLYLFHIRLEELQEIEKLCFSKNIVAKKIWIDVNKVDIKREDT